MKLPPPFAVIQARYASTRLPGKMLLDLGGETVLARAHRRAVQAFGAEHVVVAIPATDAAGPLGAELARIKARVFAWGGPEADVLGRFAACAQAFRWRPESVIVRITPEDFRKDPDAMRRVADGERMAVELGGEAFTLAALLDADRTVALPECREHITAALFATSPVAPPPGEPWTIDTPEDYEAAVAWVATNEQRTVPVGQTTITLDQPYGIDTPPVVTFTHHTAIVPAAPTRAERRRAAKGQP